jgi:putative membrane protein insertion efficiency factor
MLKKAVLLLIGFYRAAISPFFPASCRFTPSCSLYAKEAIDEYGVARGGLLSVKRILKCHPWHPGGYDPVIKPAEPIIKSIKIETGK